MWVFGYGSLMWRVGFQYDDKIVGYIKGYRRVFYQGNTDHRGTPELPGRTVTLEQADGATCWGIAYCVSGREKEQIALSHLELREKEYDVRAHVDLYTDYCSNEPAITGVLVYIASSDRNRNKYYLGMAPMKDMAGQIARAVGPSGPNAEYIFLLQNSLREIGCEDEELNNLASEVQNLLQ